jgi:lipid II:glycine glycyltransferase (peptidoglycan interpeptide bridge formation enzyme)
VQRIESNDENCRQMYNLLAATAEGSFRIRHYDYYKTFWQRYAQADQGQLFFAYVDGKIVAGAYAVVFGAKSTYKDGASIRERTVYGASHLLQWHVITWAKEKGSVTHDFCGSPPSSEIKNPEHPHYGIGRFKTSFNKEVTDYIGAWDIVIRPTAYKIWTKIGERIVLRLHNMLHHENWY